MKLILPYDTAHGIVQRIPEPADTGTQLIVLFDNNIKLPATPFNIAIYPCAVTPLAVSAEIARVTLVLDTGVGTHVLKMQRKTEGDVSRIIQVGDQVLCGVTYADLTAVENASTPVASAEKLILPDSEGYLHNNGSGKLEWKTPASESASSSGLPDPLEPITAAELKDDDQFIVKIDETEEIKGLSKSELMKTALMNLGGATISSSTVDITLTATSTRVQDVAMTAVDKSVFLPDATTLTIGGIIFVVRNSGVNRFIVRNSVGGALAILDRRQVATFFCTDISTSSGLWLVGNESYNGANIIGAGTNITVNDISSTAYTQVARLSDTKSICVYSAGNKVYAVVFESTGSAVAAGTILEVDPVTSAYTSVVACSETKAVCFYRGASYYPCAVVLEISGTTITKGNITLIDSVACSYNSIAALSSTKVICAYQGLSDYLQAVVLDLSGTIITKGTILNVNAVVSTRISVATLSATQAVCTYRGTSGYLQALTLNVSESTITSGAVLTVNSSSVTYISLAALSATQAVCLYSVGSCYAVILSVSDTTITAGTALQVKDGSTSYPSITKLSSTKLFCVYVVSSSLTAGAILMPVSPTTLIVDNASTLHTSISSYATIAALTATKMSMAYVVSNKAQTMIVEAI